VVFNRVLLKSTYFEWLPLFFLAIAVSYDQDITGLVPSIIFLYNNNNPSLYQNIHVYRSLYITVHSFSDVGEVSSKRAPRAHCV